MSGSKDNFAWVKEPEPWQKNLKRFFPGGNVGPLKSRGALLCLDKLLWVWSLKNSLRSGD